MVTVLLDGITNEEQNADDCVKVAVRFPPVEGLMETEVAAHRFVAPSVQVFVTEAAPDFVLPAPRTLVVLVFQREVCPAPAAAVVTSTPSTSSTSELVSEET